MGVGVMVTPLFFASALAVTGRDADDVAGGGASSFVRKRTALVTPKVSATPKDMSAMSACVSPLSAFDVVGFLSKSLLSLSAMMPNTVPTPAAATASPPVMYAGSLLRGSGGGGGGVAGGGGGGGTAATGGGGGGGGSASRSAATVCVDAKATSMVFSVGRRPGAERRTTCCPGDSSTSTGVGAGWGLSSILTLAPGGFDSRCTLPGSALISPSRLRISSPCALILSGTWVRKRSYHSTAARKCPCESSHMPMKRSACGVLFTSLAALNSFSAKADRKSTR